MNGTLTIPNVDLKKLDKQRLMLAKIAHTKGQLLEPEELTALDGIVNMLDAWSDARYLAIANNKYPLEDWRYNVTNGDTKLGYKDWVQHNVESDKEGK